MMKHLLRAPWIMGALFLGIIACLALIAYLLISRGIQAAVYPDAYLVWEAVRHAAV